MLKFYLTKEQVPVGKKVLMDVEHEFGKAQIPFNEYSKSAVKEIDRGRLLSGILYESEYGPEVFVSFLSTGCKAALLAPIVTGVLNLSEAGVNALCFILGNVQDGEFFYPQGADMPLQAAPTHVVPVMWGNTLCISTRELLAAQKEGVR